MSSLKNLTFTDEEVARMRVKPSLDSLSFSDEEVARMTVYKSPVETTTEDELNATKTGKKPPVDDETLLAPQSGQEPVDASPKAAPVSRLNLGEAESDLSHTQPVGEMVKAGQPQVPPDDDGIPDQVPVPGATADSTEKASVTARRLASKMADPAGKLQLEGLAKWLGTDINDPEFQKRMQTRVKASEQLYFDDVKNTGIDRAYSKGMNKEGEAGYLAATIAAVQLFGDNVAAVPIERNDATIYRIAADQKIKIVDHDPDNNFILPTVPGSGLATSMINRFKTVEQMTKREQNLAVPHRILSAVDELIASTEGDPSDAKKRGALIRDFALAETKEREKRKAMASLELDLRKEITKGESTWFQATRRVLAQGVQTLGYGNVFQLVGPYGAALISGHKKTSELMSPTIDPDTGKVLVEGMDPGKAAAVGYAYGAFESASEVALSKVVGWIFRGVDKMFGGFAGRALSRAGDKAMIKMTRTKLGRGMVGLYDATKSIMGLSALDHPGMEHAEETVQQFTDKVFASRPGDNLTPTYVKNVFNEATGQIEQVPVKPHSGEEKTAQADIFEKGNKSSYVEAGTRSMTLVERSKEFYRDFFTVKNQTELAQGFALQYLLNIAGGGVHAATTAETQRGIIAGLKAIGYTDAGIARMTPEQRYNQFNRFYGKKANQDAQGEAFKTTSELVKKEVAKVQFAQAVNKSAKTLKPNFTVDVAKEFESGVPVVTHDESGFSGAKETDADGNTVCTATDLDGILKTRTYTGANAVEQLQKGLEDMSRIKQAYNIKMNDRAEIATRAANVFAPGRTMVFVANNEDFKAAAQAEFEKEGQELDADAFISKSKAITTPGGTIILNLGPTAHHSLRDVIESIKHETGHSVGKESGLNAMMEGKSVAELGPDLQAAGIIPPGKKALDAFNKDAAYVMRRYTGAAIDQSVKTLQDQGFITKGTEARNEFLKTAGAEQRSFNESINKLVNSLQELDVVPKGDEAKIKFFETMQGIQELIYTGGHEAIIDALQGSGLISDENAAAPGVLEAVTELQTEQQKRISEMVETLQKSGVATGGDEAKGSIITMISELNKTVPYQSVVVEEVLSMLHEGTDPVFKKRFGDRLVKWMQGKGAKPMTLSDARREARRIMDSGKQPQITLFGGEDAWAAPPAIFDGDPMATGGDKITMEPEGAEGTPIPPAEGEAPAEDAPGTSEDAPGTSEDAPGTSKAPPASKPKSSNPFNQNIGGKNYKLRQKRLGKVQIVVTPDGATKPSEVIDVDGTQAGHELFNRMIKEARAAAESKSETKTPPAEGEQNEQEPIQEPSADGVDDEEQAGSGGADGDAEGSGVAAEDKRDQNKGPEDNIPLTPKKKKPLIFSSKEAFKKWASENMEEASKLNEGDAIIDAEAAAAEAAESEDETPTPDGDTDTGDKVEAEDSKPKEPKKAPAPKKQEAKPDLELDGGSVGELKAEAEKIAKQKKAQADRDEIKRRTNESITGDTGKESEALPGMDDLIPEKEQPLPLTKFARENEKSEAKPDSAPKKTEAPKAEAPKTPDMDTMVAEARRWSGAALKADGMYDPADKRSRIDHTRITTKGDMDAYLMRKFGISDTTARDVSNELTRKNLKPDTSASVEDFKGEPWADKAMEYAAKADADKVSPEPRQSIDKVEPERPVFDADYTGPRFTYGMRNRPLQIGAQPKGFIIDSLRDSDKFKFGTIQYPRQLTDKEVYDFELVPVADAKDTEDKKEEVKPERPSKPVFKNMEDVKAYMRQHIGETSQWDENSFIIDPGSEYAIDVGKIQPEAPAGASTADEQEEVFVPPKRIVGQSIPAWNRAKKAAREEWDKKQAEKRASKKEISPPLPAEGDKLAEKPAVQKAGEGSKQSDSVTQNAKSESQSDLSAVDGTQGKDIEETRESKLNREAMDAIAAIPAEELAKNPTLAAFDAVLPLYNQMEALKHRSALSQENQAYSTPSPLAALIIAILDNVAAVVDPTGGNGGLFIAIGADGKHPKVVANELDKGRAERLEALINERFGQTGNVTQGDYKSKEFQSILKELSKEGKVAYLLNPPFGAKTKDGYKLEHSIALNTIKDAKVGDTMFFIGAAPGRDVMSMDAGRLAGKYTAGNFAKFHSELNRQGWKPIIHFIADGNLYKKMGASFPVEVMLMEKTDGKIEDLHRPMRDAPGRYATWEQVREAVAERTTLDKDGKNTGPRYRLFDNDDIEMGIANPITDSVPTQFAMDMGLSDVWNEEFAGKIHSPSQLAQYLITLPVKIAKDRIINADAIVKFLASNPDNHFYASPEYRSMGPVMRDALAAKFNALRDSELAEPTGELQLPYSKLSDVELFTEMMLPRELAGAIMQAQDGFYLRHPEGIDAFVANKMGWTLEQLNDGRLDGSQVDTLAFAIEKIDDNTGYIIGSQTGAGKGRVLAAIIEYHIKNGRIPIFITDRAKLFTDMWRDIEDVKAGESAKPFVFNDYKAPQSEDDISDDVFSMPMFHNSGTRATALISKKMPEGLNAVFATYTQFQNQGAATQNKIKFIRKLLASGQGALILDEAHLAAGADSNRGQVMREFADMAGTGVVFSSATFAKRAENMTLYKRAGYSAFFKNDAEMDFALEYGGVPFQQYLAYKLTEKGFYVRHELDYTGIKFETLNTIDTLDNPQARTALARKESDTADAYNKAVRSIMRFGQLVKGVNSKLQKGAPQAQMDGAAFMNSLHNTASFIYSAMKADAIGNAAVESLRNGRAPVITLYNTNQSLLDAIGEGNEADVGRYLTRLGDKATTLVTPNGEKFSILTNDGFRQLVRLVKAQEAAEIVQAAQTLQDQISSAAEYLRKQNLPASPIDRIRNIVEDAGFQFAEVTGRTRMVEKGIVKTRKAPNQDSVLNTFNNSVTVDGKPNTVLLINTSGATGLSAHANPGFKNHATREMFVLQPAWDINEMMQIFGRVNRKNQLSKPIYHLVFTTAAGEQRNAAILMSKLRSLSANTSGVSKAGYGETSSDALDFMNEYGNDAWAELLKEGHPSVRAINDLRDTGRGGIRKASATAMFLPVREQEAFIEALQQKVADLQEQARESGMHRLEAYNIGRVMLTPEQLLTGTAGIMRAYEVRLVTQGKILTGQEAATEAEAWHEANPNLLDDAFSKIDDAIEHTNVEHTKKGYADAKETLERTVQSIGEPAFAVDLFGQRYCFIPTGVHLPASGTAQTPSSWRVRVSFNNIRGSVTMPMSIFNKMLSKSNRTSLANYNDTLTRADTRTIVAGDIAKALIGNIVSTGGQGNTQVVRVLPGSESNFSSFVLLMPRGITVKDAKNMVSAKEVRVTDIRDIENPAKATLSIDSGRILVIPIMNRGVVDGAQFNFRGGFPLRSKSKNIQNAEIMRKLGFFDLVSRSVKRQQDYVRSRHVSVDVANKALAKLAELSPALEAKQIVTDESSVGGKADKKADPRYRLDDTEKGTVLGDGSSAGIRYRLVEDADLIKKLESEETFLAYRAMNLIDNQLYPPMSTKVDGKMREAAQFDKWEMSEERPDLATDDGIFALKKEGGGVVYARYNPYLHVSLSMLNDQFKTAWNHNFVTVEVEVPVSELTSGYHAYKAKDPVGLIKWNSGPVSRQLAKMDGGESRKVILTRFDKPKRIVPNSEVADNIVKMLRGANITIPENVVSADLRKELIKRGVSVKGVHGLAAKYSTPRYRLTDDTPLNAPVRIGRLPTRLDLRKRAGDKFKILDWILTGSKIVIPENTRGGEYDWLTHSDALSQFTNFDRAKLFEINSGKRSNIDELARTFGYESVDEFGQAFLAEVNELNELYEEARDTFVMRQEAINAIREEFAGKQGRDEKMGQAISDVIGAMSEDMQEEMTKLQQTEGSSAVRDYIMKTHYADIIMRIKSMYAAEENAEANKFIYEAMAQDEAARPDYDKGTFGETVTDKAGNLTEVFRQRKVDGQRLSQILDMPQSERGPKITHEMTTSFVRKFVSAGEEAVEALRAYGKDLINKRLSGEAKNALYPYQNAVMLWYQVDLDNRRKGLAAMAREYSRSADGKNLKLINEMEDILTRDARDYLDAIATYGTLAGQALNAMKLAVDGTFNVVKLYKQARTDNGGIALTPEKFEALEKRIAELEKAWLDYVDAKGTPSSAEGLEERIAELEASILGLSEFEKEQREEFEELSGKRQALTTELGEMKISATQLSEEKAQVEKQISDLRQEIERRTMLGHEVDDLKNQVDDLNNKLAELEFRYAGVTQERIDELKSQIEKLNQEYARKRGEYSTAVADLKTAMERLKRTQKLIDKLSKSTSETIKRTREVTEVSSMLYGIFKAKMEAYQVDRIARQWRGSNIFRKANMADEIFWNTIRAVKSSFDESVAGKQLGKLLLAHPILWVRALAQTQRTIFSLKGQRDIDGRPLTYRERSDKVAWMIDEAMHEHDMYKEIFGVGEMSKIDLTADLKSIDEMQMPITGLMRKLPKFTGAHAVAAGIDVSNNHYAAMSNLLRFTVACQLHEFARIMNNGADVPAQEVKNLVGIVEIFGSRGDLTTQRAKQMLGFTQRFLWSARLTLSNIQFFTRMAKIITPGSGYSAQARIIMASEYLRMALGYAVVTAAHRILLGMLRDDPDEQRFQGLPGHPAFLQFMVGVTRRDFTGGAAQMLRSVMNIFGGIIPGHVKGISHKVSTETGMELGARPPIDIFAAERLLRSKLNPKWGIISTVFHTKTYSGKAAGPFAKPYQAGYDDRYLNMFLEAAPVPLSMERLIELVHGDKDNGIEPINNPLLIADAMLWEILGIGGSSLPVNPGLANEVKEGYTKNAKKFESLKRKQRNIRNNKTMSDEEKAIRSESLQYKIDAYRNW